MPPSPYREPAEVEEDDPVPPKPVRRDPDSAVPMLALLWLAAISAAVLNSALAR